MVCRGASVQACRKRWEDESLYKMAKDCWQKVADIIKMLGEEKKILKIECLGEYGSNNIIIIIITTMIILA